MANVTKPMQLPKISNFPKARTPRDYMGNPVENDNSEAEFDPNNATNRVDLVKQRHYNKFKNPSQNVRNK